MILSSWNAWGIFLVRMILAFSMTFIAYMSPVSFLLTDDEGSLTLEYFSEASLPNALQNFEILKTHSCFTLIR